MPNQVLSDRSVEVRVSVGDHGDQIPGVGERNVIGNVTKWTRQRCLGRLPVYDNPVGMRLGIQRQSPQP